jgi:hypothetical protein
MAKGISITITRLLHYRKPRPDDAVFHSVWGGSKWVSLAFPVYKPLVASEHGRPPEIVTTTLEFPPAGVVPIQRRKLKAEMQRRLLA